MGNFKNKLIKNVSSTTSSSLPSAAPLKYSDDILADCNGSAYGDYNPAFACISGTGVRIGGSGNNLDTDAGKEINNSDMAGDLYCMDFKSLPRTHFQKESTT